MGKRVPNRHIAVIKAIDDGHTLVEEIAAITKLEPRAVVASIQRMREIGHVTSVNKRTPGGKVRYALTAPLDEVLAKVDPALAPVTPVPTAAALIEFFGVFPGTGRKPAGVNAREAA